MEIDVINESPPGCPPTLPDAGGHGFAELDTLINLAKLVSLWFQGVEMMEKAMGQVGFFDLPDHLKRLSEAGDPLEEMAWVIDFEAFRPTLEGALSYGDGAKGV